MKILKKLLPRKAETSSSYITWEEKSGFLSFLKSMPLEVEKFNKTFDFNITYSVAPPAEIDGSSYLTRYVGFVMIRDNSLIPERRYCLYSLLKDRVLYGYIGVEKNGHITTIRQIQPIENFKKTQWVVYDWLRELVRASCEKYL
jgi:hypothetical protein